MYHHINQPRKRVDVVEMGKNVCKKVEMGETGLTSKNARSPMHQNLLPNNNDAQNTKKCGCLRPNTQIVALCAHCTRTVLKAPPQCLLPVQNQPMQHICALAVNQSRCKHNATWNVGIMQI